MFLNNASFTRKFIWVLSLFESLITDKDGKENDFIFYNKPLIPQ
jgi:hypothetical protein